MVLVAAMLAFLAGPTPQDLPPGPCKVTVQSASFNKVPSTTRGFLREAKVDSSWLDPDEAAEQRVKEYGRLAPGRRS